MHLRLAPPDEAREQRRKRLLPVAAELKRWYNELHCRASGYLVPHAQVRHADVQVAQQRVDERLVLRRVERHGGCALCTASSLADWRQPPLFETLLPVPLPLGVERGGVSRLQNDAQTVEAHDERAVVRATAPRHEHLKLADRCRTYCTGQPPAFSRSRLQRKVLQLQPAAAELHIEVGR